MMFRNTTLSSLARPDDGDGLRVSEWLHRGSSSPQGTCWGAGKTTPVGSTHSDADGGYTHHHPYALVCLVVSRIQCEGDISAALGVFRCYRVLHLDDPAAGDPLPWKFGVDGRTSARPIPTAGVKAKTACRPSCRDGLALAVHLSGAGRCQRQRVGDTCRYADLLQADVGDGDEFVLHSFVGRSDIRHAWHAVAVAVASE